MTIGHLYYNIRRLKRELRTQKESNERQLCRLKRTVNYLDSRDNDLSQPTLNVIVIIWLVVISVRIYLMSLNLYGILMAKNRHLLVS
jgi:hypothetical protein